jgi:hypothetical protein
MKFYISVLVLTIQVLASTAWSQQASELVNKTAQLYRTRFDAAGKYIDNAQARQQFINQQNAIVAQVKAGGYLARNVKVYNNVMSDVVVTMSVVQQAGQMVALLVERTKYNNKVEEENLRFYSMDSLIRGKTAFQYNGAPIVVIKSQQLTPEQGGMLAIKYPTNFKNNSFGEARFDILRTTAGDLAFFTPSRTGFTRIDLNIWVNIFAQNFGIDKISFK